MLIPRQVTTRILRDAQRVTKESLELRHDCRNTITVSRALRELLEEERKSGASGVLGTLFDPDNPPKGTA